MESAGLNAKQGAIVAIAAHTAGGDLKKLDSALNEGLDAGFPRSLNGLGGLDGIGSPH